MNYLWGLMPSMLEGFKTTMEVFLITLVFSIPLGILIALARLSKSALLVKIAQFYIYVMRGTPLLLQIIFIFFGLPVVGITFARFPAAIIAFVLNYAAYFGEIFRSGIQSIDKGQYEAAQVLGLSQTKTFFRIVLPQVIKRVLPPVSNEVITLIKDTALVYVVGLGELLRAGKIASNRDASLVPLVLAGVIYLAATGVLTGVLKKLEDRFAYYQ